MASRMVREGTVASTPEELEHWISEAPDVMESLEEGGYNTAFGSHDLLPLLQVFIVQAGGPAPQAEEPAAPSKRGWVIGLVLLLVILLVVVIVSLR